VRAGRNPTRRNRNIGTAAGGRGRNNRLVIASRSNGPIWHWRDIGEYRSVKRVVRGRDVTFVVERTNRGCVHACTVEDIAWLLGYIPPEDWEGLGCFVLRQPRRKEAILSAVWGRLAYGGEIGRPQDGLFAGPAVFLESTTPDFEFSLSASMRPDAQAEFERLRRDGHVITRIGRRFAIQCSVDTVRNTQLYRTMLHEIGHWVDWLQKVQRAVPPPEIRDDDYFWRERLQHEYDHRPSQERETFANRYADRMWTLLSDSGVIPFARKLDFEGLDPADFVVGFPRAQVIPATDTNNTSDNTPLG
jgi:hypothetical protein